MIWPRNLGDLPDDSVMPDIVNTLVVECASVVSMTATDAAAMN